MVSLGENFPSTVPLLFLWFALPCFSHISRRISKTNSIIGKSTVCCNFISCACTPVHCSNSAKKQSLYDPFLRQQQLSFYSFAYGGTCESLSLGQEPSAKGSQPGRIPKASIGFTLEAELGKPNKDPDSRTKFQRGQQPLKYF